MIKERKKALAEKTTLVLMECDFNASKELAVVTKLIEIVAAEVRKEGRKEGIEEMRDALVKGPRMLHAEQAKWINDEADKVLTEQEGKG